MLSPERESARMSKIGNDSLTRSDTKYLILCSCNPSLIKDINAIEAVQRRFTKRLPGMKHLTYHQRLVKLELESLELRRVRTDLLCVYKIVFGLVDVCLSDFFVSQFSDARRGHRYKLYLPPCRSNVRFNCLNYRTIRTWNSLPADVDFTSLNSFRSSLNRTLLIPFCRVLFI